MDPARARLLRQLPQVDETAAPPYPAPAVTPLPRALAAAASAAPWRTSATGSPPPRPLTCRRSLIWAHCSRIS